MSHVMTHVIATDEYTKDNEANVESIVDAADRYGISGLKLEAGASLVKSMNFDVATKNCALLKEAAMDFAAENKVNVLKNLSKCILQGCPWLDDERFAGSHCEG